MRHKPIRTEPSKSLTASSAKISGLINVHLYKKQAGYMFWAMGEQALNMGLPRLVLFPLAAYLIGRNQFGAFIMALSITSMIGSQPANGLAIGMIRNLSEFGSPQQKLFCSTANTMCGYAMSAVIVVGLAISFTVYSLNIVEPLLFYCIVPLLIALYPENQFMLDLTELRISRRFARRTGWYLIRAVMLLICGITGVILGGAIGFAWGYTAGCFISYWVLRLIRSGYITGGYDSAMASGLKKVWLHMTIAGMLSFAGPYLNKIILGFYHEYGEVADLFTATALLYAFMVVVSCMGSVLMSVLARYNSIDDLPKSIRHQFLFVVALLLVISPLFFWIASPFAFSLLFPKFGEEARDLLNIVVWSVPFVVLLHTMRPFGVKFADIKITPLVNCLSLFGTLIPAMILIPRWHAAGAAWSIVAGQMVKSLLWTYYALRLFFRKETLL